MSSGVRGSLTPYRVRKWTYVVPKPLPGLRYSRRGGLKMSRTRAPSGPARIVYGTFPGVRQKLPFLTGISSPPCTQMAVPSSRTPTVPRGGVAGRPRCSVRRRQSKAWPDHQRRCGWSARCLARGTGRRSGRRCCGIRPAGSCFLPPAIRPRRNRSHRHRHPSQCDRRSALAAQAQKSSSWLA